MARTDQETRPTTRTVAKAPTEIVRPENMTDQGSGA
jgi:hypothetical protein